MCGFSWGGPNKADRPMSKLAYPHGGHIVNGCQLIAQLRMLAGGFDSFSHEPVSVAAWTFSQHVGWFPRGREQKSPVLLKTNPQTGTTSFLLYFNGQSSPRPAKIQEGEGIDCI